MRPLQANQAPTHAAVPTPHTRGEEADGDMSAQTATVQDISPRGRTLAVPRNCIPTIWSLVGRAFAETGLRLTTAIAQQFSNPTRIQQIDTVVIACSNHRGSLTRDVSSTTNAPVYRYENVDVCGRTVDVFLRFRHFGLDGPISVVGVQVCQPGLPPLRSLRPTGVPRRLFVIRQGGTVANLESSGDRMNALQNRGTHGRWQAAMQGNLRPGRITTAIVKACAEQLRDDATRMRVIDPDWQIVCVRATFHNVEENFYLRFADQLQAEVMDVRVQDIRFNAATQRHEDESEVEVVARMKESAYQSTTGTNDGV